MTEQTNTSPAQPSRRLPAWVIVLGIGVLFVGALLVLMLIKPPQQSLCDDAAPDFTLTPLFHAPFRYHPLFNHRKPSE